MHSPKSFMRRISHMGGKTSAAAKNRYNAKAYDRITLLVPKGSKEQIAEAARAKGQSVNSYSMCQVIVGTFSYLLMSVYCFYFQTIPPGLLPIIFYPFFSRRLFQRLFLMLSALHPGVAYDV